ncbi:MAG: hypothetical protein AM325_004445, partial [Candidatus Thorarchaeota archaeon SMTZ1-45]
TPSEREEYLQAREVFNESTYMTTNGIELSLKPPIITKLVRVLSPAFGKATAEAKTREMVRLWKMFGKTQSTLEQWV